LNIGVKKNSTSNISIVTSRRNDQDRPADLLKRVDSSDPRSLSRSNKAIDVLAEATRKLIKTSKHSVKNKQNRAISEYLNSEGEES
jgi:hypothetical protein